MKRYTETDRQTDRERERKNKNESKEDCVINKHLKTTNYRLHIVVIVVNHLFYNIKSLEYCIKYLYNNRLIRIIRCNSIV